MVTIHVNFFGAAERFVRHLPPAVVRELPQVKLAPGSTVDDLLVFLQLSTDEGRPLVSVNRRYQRDNVQLADGDRVDLFTTVVGGSL